MELTLEAAFSREGLLGHLAYVLLVLSMMMRQMVMLRILVMASAVVGIAYALFILTDPVSVFWETLLILVNTGQLLLIWWTNRSTQFDTREAAFRNAHFSELSPHNFRTLLAAGTWASLPSGTHLATEGKPIPELVFLYQGNANVMVDGKLVGHCKPGGFVGEMTVFGAEPASAAVILSEPAEVWKLEAGNLRNLAKRKPEINAALDAAFFRVLRARIIDRNRMDAGTQFDEGNKPIRSGGATQAGMQPGLQPFKKGG